MEFAYPLSNPAFDANSSFLIETGPNSDIFEVEIKIPRKLMEKQFTLGIGMRLDTLMQVHHQILLKKLSLKEKSVSYLSFHMCN